MLLIPVYPSAAHCTVVRTGDTMQGAAATYVSSSGVGFPLHTNRDVMVLLTELLSNQYAFFASISKEWRNTWGDLPKRTRAITADTSVLQLQETSMVASKSHR